MNEVTQTPQNIRLIKKYPNRRLYDTAISSYITLEEIKQLVLSSVVFQVVDARSGEDLTHNTLLQIIADQEEHGSPLLSTEVLQHMIRVYGNSMQTLMSQFIRESLNYFNSQKENFSAQPLSPMHFFANLTEQSTSFWNMFQNSASTASTKETESVTDGVES